MESQSKKTRNPDEDSDFEIKIKTKVREAMRFNPCPQLPLEVWNNVFTFVQDIKIIISCSRVNSMLHHITHYKSATFWKHMEISKGKCYNLKR